ncbi:MAG: NAD-dependent epimerase/dehydratase family protein [Geminicoccaceae bacterium]
MGPEIGLTGGTGFIGGHFLRRCRETSGEMPRLRMLHRRAGDARPDVRSIRGSLEDEESLARLTDGAEVVVHLGGSIKARDKAAFAHSNIEATARLARIAERSGVRRFLLASSLAATAPDASNYAWSKSEGEKAAAAELSHCQLEILRPPAIYGPGDRMTLPIFKQIAAGVLFAPKGGMSRFSLLHVEDLADLLLSLVRAPQGETVIEPDDGHADGYGWCDLAEAGASIAGRPVRVAHLPRWLLSTLATLCDGISAINGAVLPLSRDKLGELYQPRWVARGDRPSGWEPRTGFAEGAAQTMRWYREAGWI